MTFKRALMIALFGSAGALAVAGGHRQTPAARTIRAAPR